MTPSTRPMQALSSFSSGARPSGARPQRRTEELLRALLERWVGAPADLADFH